MPANIFNETNYEGIKNRINHLNIQSQQKWGKMSLPQTLEHCSIQLKIVLGIIPETEYEGSSLFRTSVGRWLVLYPMPWPKGAATPSQMNMLTNRSPVADIEDSKKKLLDLLHQVQRQGHFNRHPLFGNMGRKDWGRLIWKHLDHHLRQFGN